MYVFRAVCLAGSLKLRVRSKRIFHEASLLFFIGSMFLYRFNDDAVDRAIRVFRNGAKTRPKLGRKANCRRF